MAQVVPPPEVTAAVDHGVTAVLAALRHWLIPVEVAVSMATADRDTHR
jgi:hypothetical protein